MFDQVRCEELDRSVASLCGVVHAATASLVEVLAGVLASEAWAEPGIRSAVHWVTWRCGVSTSRARSWVQMAERLDELPLTFEAFRRVSWPRTRWPCSCATSRPPTTPTAWPWPGS